LLLKSTDPLERYLVELVQAQGMLGSHEHAYAAGISTHQQLCVATFHEFAGYLNDVFAGEEDIVVLHDLRVQCELGSAHIDHMIMTRYLDVFLIESRIAGDQVIVGPEEEFSVKYRDGNSYRIRSPITQLRRALAVSQHIFRRIELPTRFGERILPEFHRRIVVPRDTRLTNHSEVRQSYFVNPRDLVKTVKKCSKQSALKTLFGGISTEDLNNIARIVARWHAPEKVDFMRKYLATPVSA
jgi:hypothetical protein